MAAKKKKRPFPYFQRPNSNRMEQAALLPQRNALRLRERIGTATVDYRPDAPLARIGLDCQYFTQPAQKNPPRGKVTTWSFRSKRRLRYLLMSINRGSLDDAVFVTLTIPAGKFADISPAIFKKSLSRWIQCLQSKYPLCAVIWKMEYHKSGLPHIHAFVYGVPRSMSFTAYATKTWIRIINSRNQFHIDHGCHVMNIESYNQCIYLLKYAGKSVDDEKMQKEWGRYWGNTKNIMKIVSRPLRFRIPTPAAIKIFRSVRKLCNFQKKHLSNARYFCVFDRETIPKLLKYYCGAEIPIAVATLPYKQDAFVLASFSRRASRVAPV